MAHFTIKHRMFNLGKFIKITRISLFKHDK